MTPSRAHAPAVAGLALAWLAACAGAPPLPPPPAVAWPEAPASPRARLVAVLPAGPVAGDGGWDRFLDVVTGRERRPVTAAFPALPFGVAGLADGGWAVADPEAPAVAILRPGAPVELRTCPGLPWSAPMAVVALEGALLVADAGAARLVELAPGGACHLLAGGFERPTGLAAGAGRIYVVDAPRRQVVVLARDGAVLARLGDGALHLPTAAALAPDGSLLVADGLDGCLVRFGPGGEVAGLVGGRDEAGGGLVRPKGVAVDARGTIYVSDGERDQVLVYRADGAFEGALGQTGSAPGQLLAPAGLAVAGGRLAVADARNRRVQIFELVGGES